MTSRAWRLRDRPIGQSERRAALAIVVVLLATGSLLLLVTRPGPELHATPPPPRAITSPPGTPPAGALAADSARVAPVAACVAHRFLAGYLAYLYGHTPARAITGAVPALIRSLRARPLLVSPAMRARRPRVLALQPIPAPAGTVGLSALVGDGELAHYSLGLLLKRARHGRLLVVAVEGA